MPADQLIMRHGTSELNEASRRANKGDSSLFTEESRTRHVAGRRLTSKGCLQAKQAGLYLQEAFPAGFGRYVTSDNVRAFETAVRMELPGARWDRRIELGERDWGDMDMLSPAEKQERYAASLALNHQDPLWWRPPNGERFSEVCTRVGMYQMQADASASDERPDLVVCHFEVMKAFGFYFFGAFPEEFGEQHRNKGPEHHIDNCDIYHYSSRNPHTREVGSKIEWLRKIRPTVNPVDVSPWIHVGRRLYSNAELLRIVEGYPRFIPNE